jgi:hypothetical protein
MWSTRRWRELKLNQNTTGQALRFTGLQGQYLAFIWMYTLLHRQPPAERDIQDFFRVTAPSIHSMVLTLDERGLIHRVPGQPRSIRVLVPIKQLPTLQDPLAAQAVEQSAKAVRASRPGTRR